MRGKWLALALAAGACGTDPGDDWVQVQGVPEVFSVNDVWSFAPDDVWAVGSQGTVLRFDGAAWSTEQAPVTSDLTGIWGFTPSDIWACGGTSILHYDGATWSIVEDVEKHGLDGLTSIWASSANDVWVAGDDAIFVHWNGTTSTRMTGPSPFNHHVFGTGPKDVWALGTFDLSHYDGTEWTAIDPGIFGGEGEVWGTGPADIWVVTDSEEAAHWDGASFTVFQNDDLIGGLAALWGTASDDIWAAGAFGSIAHWNGSRWTQVQHQKIGSPQLRQFFGVHASSSTDVWAVGQVLDDQGARGIVHHFEP